MGRPYSTDVRERVLRACEAGEASQAAIARRFAISESAVGSWLRYLHHEGRREPKPHGRGFR
jgi:transposase